MILFAVYLIGVLGAIAGVVLAGIAWYLRRAYRGVGE